MQDFLKGKVIKELIKGVATMKTFLYPSVLQHAAIPALKGPQKNVVLKYSEMSGVKLTLFLPLLNQQIKHSILQQDSDKVTYSLVLCHSNKRCGDLADFARLLTTFCQDIIDVVTFEGAVYSELKAEWDQKCKEAKGEEDDDEDEKYKKQV
mmetsp:Transcript_19401/g.29793  ORF Transcript_19401/g.29793 Transcript_19401/m.29793 type:complete len:151 (-) Transcript_19401:1557-2009(-)